MQGPSCLGRIYPSINMVQNGIDPNSKSHRKHISIWCSVLTTNLATQTYKCLIEKNNHVKLINLIK